MGVSTEGLPVSAPKPLTQNLNVPSESPTIYDLILDLDDETLRKLLGVKRMDDIGVDRPDEAKSNLDSAVIVL